MRNPLRDTPRRFAVAALLSHALAAAAAYPILSAFRVGSGRPLALEPRLSAADPGGTGVGFVTPALDLPWTTQAATPAAGQSEGIASLAEVWLALGLLALVLAGANLVVLWVRRGEARRTELALRVALGAGRRQALAAALAEPAAIAGLGAAIGLGVGAFGTAVLRGSLPPGVGGALPLVSPLASLALLAPALATVLAGVAPMRSVRAGWRAPVRLRPGRSIWDRSVAAAHAGAVLALLVAAGALVRAYGGGPELGGLPIDPRDTLLVELTPASEAQGVAPAADPGALVRAVEAASAVQGVRAATFASAGTVRGLGTVDFVTSECDCSSGGMPLPYLFVDAEHHAVAPGFFAATGIPLLRGREFTPEDAAGGAPGVALIDRTFADRFGGVDPLGKKLVVAGQGHGGPWLEIVGIVETLASPSPGRSHASRPAVYLPALQSGPFAAELVLRWDGPLATDGGTGADARPMGEAASGTDAGAAADAGVAADAGAGMAIRAIAPALAAAGLRPERIRTLGSALEALASPLVWFAGSFALLAGLVVALAVEGLASVVWLDVVRRRAEIGLRRAVGARRRDVIRLVLREARTPLVVGFLLGGSAAVGFLVGLADAFPAVRALDVSLLAAGVGILLATAIVSAWIPARAASRLDPAAALSSD